MCDAWKTWHDRCAESEAERIQGDDYYNECVTEPFWRATWASAVDRLNQCFDTLSCESSDDRCLAETIEAFDIDPYSDPLVDACFDHADTCEFSDDRCASILFYVERARVEIERCFRLDCASITQCTNDPLGWQP